MLTIEVLPKQSAHMPNASPHELAGVGTLNAFGEFGPAISGPGLAAVGGGCWAVSS
jgi:hypothetical protein